MVKLSEEKIKVIYEGKQLGLEEALLEDLNSGGERHVHGNLDCGVFCVLEMVDERPLYEMLSRGVKIDLYFQGRQCDFEKFADHLGLQIESSDFKISPAPEHKPPSLCTLNKSQNLKLLNT